MKLIRYGHLIINPAQIVEAVYKGRSEKREPELLLLYAVPESDPRTDYEGEFIANDYSPYKRTFRGDMAEQIWDKVALLCD